MTQLREKMQEDLQLHGLSNLTQDLYIRSVRQLAEYYRKSPDQITEEELRQYFLYLKNDKQYAPSTLTVALCGIRFFYERTLQREMHPAAGNANLGTHAFPRSAKVTRRTHDRGSASRTGRRSHARCACLLEHHLCLRVAHSGRGVFASSGY